MTSPPTDGPQPPDRAEAAVLDADALARLRALDPEGRNQVVQRVMSAFEASLQRMVVQLAQLGEAESVPELTLLAHTMKSSAAAVGALALSQACARVERRLRDGGPGDFRSDLDSLSHEAAAALQAVRAMLRA